MKLYILYQLDKVIAISEYDYYIDQFYLLIRNELNQYHIEEISSKKKINKYLIKYSDYLLTEYEDFIIRECDTYIINNMIYTYRYKVKNTIDMLSSINENCIMNPSEHENISQSIKILSKYSKKKKFNDFIYIKDTIRTYYNNRSFQYELNELEKRYQYSILNY